jgi:DNA-directed RNA polymerase subunit RPC12/RpoP
MKRDIWHEGKWYPRTGYLCRRCGHPVYKTDLAERGYSYQCFECDEDLFSFEVMEEEDYGMGVCTDAAAAVGASGRRGRCSG